MFLNCMLKNAKIMEKTNYPPVSFPPGATKIICVTCLLLFVMIFFNYHITNTKIMKNQKSRIRLWDLHKTIELVER